MSESQFGSNPQIQPAGQLTADKSGSGAQSLQGLLYLSAVEGEEDLCIFEIGGHVCPGDGDHSVGNPGILYVPENHGYFLCHTVVDAALSVFSQRKCLLKISYI